MIQAYASFLGMSSILLPKIFESFCDRQKAAHSGSRGPLKEHITPAGEEELGPQYLTPLRGYASYTPIPSGLGPRPCDGVHVRGNRSLTVAALIGALSAIERFCIRIKPSRQWDLSPLRGYASCDPLPTACALGYHLLFVTWTGRKGGQHDPRFSSLPSFRTGFGSYPVGSGIHVKC